MRTVVVVIEAVVRIFAYPTDRLTRALVHLDYN